MANTSSASLGTFLRAAGISSATTGSLAPHWGGVGGVSQPLLCQQQPETQPLIVVQLSRHSPAFCTKNLRKLTPRNSFLTLIENQFWDRQKKKKPFYRTEFWNAVQSSWKRESDGISSSLHFFRIDCSVLVKSDVYLKRQELV